MMITNAVARLSVRYTTPCWAIIGGEPRRLAGRESEVQVRGELRDHVVPVTGGTDVSSPHKLRIPSPPMFRREIGPRAPRSSTRALRCCRMVVDHTPDPSPPHRRDL